MEILDSPFGKFQLSRYPKRAKETLRAWDAADEFILNQINEENLLHKESKVLIINDQFGALSVALSHYSPVVVSDSWLAHAGIKANLLDNDLPEENTEIRNSLDYPEGKFDLILLKIPKSLAMLEDQLIRIRPLLSDNTRVIAGGMVKAIHTSTLKLFEKIIGPTKTSLAKKKARLIFPDCTNDGKEIVSPYPSGYTLENTHHEIINHAGVFSRDSLDIGTRFFLQHLPDEDKYQRIIDLGCGNGVVGLMAAERNPSAELTFVDESFMAVASASENFNAAFANTRTGSFLATDCLQGIEKNSADLILNNPPFHQQNVVGDFIALQMFREAKSVLKKGGEIWVIGNRHLGYHQRLKKLFGNCSTVASNKKFVILKAVKQ